MKNIRKFLKLIKRSYFYLFILTIIAVSCVSVIKYKKYDVNYYNADATWHTLLTIDAYDKTAISKHLFLPIISLGNSTDKNISWGNTIPDNEGNYYYTSFSPAGYFLPWLFFKVFNLPVAEKSLYIFNTVLFAISAILWIRIITFIYDKNKYVHFLAIISLCVYICAPEILHGMGIVYWHHSIFQVTFLIQLYTYLLAKQNNSKIAKYVFYGMILINPYIEWTGYVANVGFAIVEIITYWKQNRKKAFKKVILIIFLTICSFILFCFHYLLVINAGDLFSNLKDRFMARNITNKVSILSLFKGYLSSFKYLYVILTILIIWNFVKNKRLNLKNKCIIFLCFFPIIENFIMKQHAILYSYDRMKLIFPISLLICELIQNIIANTKDKKVTLTMIFIITILCSIFNIKNYINDTRYVWKVDYLDDNKKLATYINTNYENSLLATETVCVRGYLNLLFEKGIYELKTYDEVKNIAEDNNQDYVVILNINSGSCNTYKLAGATIYNVETNVTYELSIQDGRIQLSTFCR